MTYEFQYAISWRDIELIGGLGQGILTKAKTDEEALEKAKKMLTGNIIFVSVEDDGRFVGSFWNKKRLEDKLKEVESE
jgi:hypothetical protein